MKRRHKILFGAAAVVVVALAVYYRQPVAAGLLAFGATVHDLGHWGPVALTAALAIAVPLCLPTAPLLLAAGVLFGAGAGFVYALVGITAGGALAFFLARRLLRSWLERRLASHAGFEVVSEALAREGLHAVALLRLSPALPAWLINYSLGVSRVSWRDYWLSTVSILPVIALYAFAGAGLGDLAALESGAAAPRGSIYYALLGLGVFATLAASILLGRRARRVLVEAKEKRS